MRPILEKTYGVMCYQESLMALARELAGFDLVEVDQLRKASGKKDQALMAEVGKLFVKKAERLGVVTREQAESIFDNMRKSGRYLFNKCISGYTKILRPTRDKHSKSWCPLTVGEMYRIRNDPAYAKA